MLRVKHTGVQVGQIGQDKHERDDCSYTDSVSWPIIKKEIGSSRKTEPNIKFTTTV
jgi:hypothetical protein